MTTEKLGVLIAERVLDLISDDRTTTTRVVVKLGKPKQVPGYSVFQCRFQILGMGTEKIRYGEGADAIQALILALTKIGSLLYTSDESINKRLSWMEMLNLGFPAFVTEHTSYLVPEHAEKLLL